MCGNIKIVIVMNVTSVYWIRVKFIDYVKSQKSTYDHYYCIVEKLGHVDVTCCLGVG